MKPLTEEQWEALRKSARSVTPEEHEELKQLSKEAFGSSSRWKTYVENGIAELYEREREVLVPKANGELAKKTFKDHKYVTRRYTVDEIKKEMQDILVKRKELAKAVEAMNAQPSPENTPTE
jgi:hypothetical protein